MRTEEQVGRGDAGDVLARQASSATTFLGSYWYFSPAYAVGCFYVCISSLLTVAVYRVCAYTLTQQYPGLSDNPLQKADAVYWTHVHMTMRVRARAHTHQQPLKKALRDTLAARELYGV